MRKQNPVQKFLDLLSQFSIVEKTHRGKRSVYSIPNLLDGAIPDLEQIKKLTKPYKVRISNDGYYEIILIY